jgi:hypothetical protein
VTSLKLSSALLSRHLGRNLLCGSRISHPPPRSGLDSLATLTSAKYRVIINYCPIAVGVVDVVECVASVITCLRLVSPLGDATVARLTAHPKFVWVFNANCDGTIIYNIVVAHIICFIMNEHLRLLWKTDFSLATLAKDLHLSF